MSLPPIAPRTLFFRVDGSASIGLGHLMRCQALAQALAPAFRAAFIVREVAAEMQQQLADAGIVLRLMPSTLATGLPEAEWIASHLAPTDSLVLDGYHFGPAYQRRLAATGAALVCLDDLITPPTWADVVLNQAGGVAPAAYAQVPLARLYLGPAYALLRPAFWQPILNPDASATRRLFLNMGGADPGNQTLALLPQLRQQFPGYEVAVVTGAAYPHQAALQAATAADSHVALHNNLPASEMAALLRTCQVFVCPPSGVAYECCAAGGVVLLHPTADNQRALFEFLTSQELALPLADGLALSEAELPLLAARQLPQQRALFDGRAGERLQTVFSELFASQQYMLRRATAADAALYFNWANDPAVRQFAIHPEPIGWDTHVAWFTRRLQDTDSYLYVLSTAGGEPVGQVRIEFDGPGQPGLIDYSVAAAHRGRGLGAVLLRRALQRLRHDRPRLAGGALLGQVQAGNMASVRVFEGLRFVRQAAVTLRGEGYEVFRLDFPLDF